MAWTKKDLQFHELSCSAETLQWHLWVLALPPLLLQPSVKGYFGGHPFESYQIHCQVQESDVKLKTKG